MFEPFEAHRYVMGDNSRSARACAFECEGGEEVMCTSLVDGELQVPYNWFQICYTTSQPHRGHSDP